MRSAQWEDGQNVLVRKKRDRLGNSLVPLDSASARYVELFIVLDSTARQLILNNAAPSNLARSQLNQLVYLANTVSVYF